MSEKEEIAVTGVIRKVFSYREESEVCLDSGQRN